MDQTKYFQLRIARADQARDEPVATPLAPAEFKDSFVVGECIRVHETETD